MGYTTNFKGKFELSKEPTIKVLIAIDSLEDMGEDRPEGPAPWPDGYCQWQMTRDKMGIEWDGNEKFYDYVDWLQAIIDNILTPAGIALTGEVTYQGESWDDAGVLRVVGCQVVKEETGVVVADLKAFKEFVLKSEYGEVLLETYQRRGGI
jgi:hypothetical protein